MDDLKRPVLPAKPSAPRVLTDAEIEAAAIRMREWGSTMSARTAPMESVDLRVPLR